jgi:NADPH:quinone reductase
MRQHIAHSKRTKFPLVLGTDGAGEVVAKGTRVTRFDLEDRVWSYEYANPKGGFYAEYVAVDARKAARVPPGLDLLHAGASATTGLTALQGIDDALRTRPGDTVLVFGASGAVGTLAVQFAKRRRARVIATASPGKATTLHRGLDADAVIDARSKTAVEELRGFAPDGIDAALALAGGEELERCLDQVRKGGVSYPNGIEPEPRHRRQLRIQSYDALTGSKELTRLGRAVKEARLRVPLAAVFPLARAADAHRRQHQRVIGRIVLRINGNR